MTCYLHKQFMLRVVAHFILLNLLAHSYVGNFSIQQNGIVPIALVIFATSRKLLGRSLCGEPVFSNFNYPPFLQSSALGNSIPPHGNAVPFYSNLSMPSRKGMVPLRDTYYMIQLILVFFILRTNMATCVNGNSYNNDR